MPPRRPRRTTAATATPAAAATAAQVALGQLDLLREILRHVLDALTDRDVSTDAAVVRAVLHVAIVCKAWNGVVVELLKISNAAFFPLGKHVRIVCWQQYMRARRALRRPEALKVDCPRGSVFDFLLWAFFEQDKIDPKSVGLTGERSLDDRKVPSWRVALQENIARVSDSYRDKWRDVLNQRHVVAEAVFSQKYFHPRRDAVEDPVYKMRRQREMTAIGRILLKSVLDGSLGTRLSRFTTAFLLDQHEDVLANTASALEALSEIDQPRADAWRALMTSHEGTVADVANYSDDSDDDEPPLEPLTSANIAPTILQGCRLELLERRSLGLNALRRGFRELELPPRFPGAVVGGLALGVPELRVLLGGLYPTTMNDVLTKIEFTADGMTDDETARSPEAHWVREVLLEFEPAVLLDRCGVSLISYDQARGDASGGPAAQKLICIPFMDIDWPGFDIEDSDIKITPPRSGRSAHMALPILESLEEYRELLHDEFDEEEWGEISEDDDE